MNGSVEFKEKVLRKSEAYKKQKQRRIKGALLSLSLVCVCAVSLAAVKSTERPPEKNDDIEGITEALDNSGHNLADQNSSRGPADEMHTVKVECSGKTYALDTDAYALLKTYLIAVEFDSAEASSSKFQNEAIALKFKVTDGESETVYMVKDEEMISKVKEIIGIEE